MRFFDRICSQAENCFDRHVAFSLEFSPPASVFDHRHPKCRHSLRKQRFLLALRRWGSFARRRNGCFRRLMPSHYDDICGYTSSVWDPKFSERKTLKMLCRIKRSRNIQLNKTLKRMSRLTSILKKSLRSNTEIKRTRRIQSTLS